MHQSRPSVQGLNPCKEGRLESMKADRLKARLKRWKPPVIPPDAKPGGAEARAFTAAIRAIKGGGFRFMDRRNRAGK